MISLLILREQAVQRSDAMISDDLRRKISHYRYEAQNLI
jgi:hypothetical protein